MVEGARFGARSGILGTQSLCGSYVGSGTNLDAEIGLSLWLSWGLNIAPNRSKWVDSNMTIFIAFLDRFSRSDQVYGKKSRQTLYLSVLYS